MFYIDMWTFGWVYVFMCVQVVIKRNRKFHHWNLFLSVI
jgi:hypothetical protein